jgi:hypothetical protein
MLYERFAIKLFMKGKLPLNNGFSKEYINDSSLTPKLCILAFTYERQPPKMRSSSCEIMVPACRQRACGYIG